MAFLSPARIAARDNSTSAQQNIDTLEKVRNDFPLLQDYEKENYIKDLIRRIENLEKKLQKEEKEHQATKDKLAKLREELKKTNSDNNGHSQLETETNKKIQNQIDSLSWNSQKQSKSIEDMQSELHSFREILDEVLRIMKDGQPPNNVPPDPDSTNTPLDYLPGGAFLSQGYPQTGRVFLSLSAASIAYSVYQYNDLVKARNEYHQTPPLFSLYALGSMSMESLFQLNAVYFQIRRNYYKAAVRDYNRSFYLTMAIVGTSYLAPLFFSRSPSANQSVGLTIYPDIKATVDRNRLVSPALGLAYQVRY